MVPGWSSARVRVRLLLDTHIALWAARDRKALGLRAAELIEAADTVFFSAISVWELSVKHAIVRRGVRQFDLSGQQVCDCLVSIGLQPLPFEVAHAVYMDPVPFTAIPLIAVSWLTPARRPDPSHPRHRLAAYGHPVMVV